MCSVHKTTFFKQSCCLILLLSSSSVSYLYISGSKTRIQLIKKRNIWKYTKLKLKYAKLKQNDIIRKIHGAEPRPLLVLRAPEPWSGSSAGQTCLYSYLLCGDKYNVNSVVLTLSMLHWTWQELNFLFLIQLFFNGKLRSHLFW